MARYAMSLEGAESLRALANRLYIAANAIFEAANTLESSVNALSSKLGIYEDEILGLIKKERTTLDSSRHAVDTLSQRLLIKASDIDAMLGTPLVASANSGVYGLRVGWAGSAVNSYQRATEGGELAVASTSALSDDLIGMFPESRRAALHTSYTNAPEKITGIINRHSGNLTDICESGYSYDGWGRPIKNGCFYSPGGKYIAMNEELNDAEYTDVFKHEVGHFVDDIMGKVSNTPEFIAAMDQTASRFDPGTPEGQMRLRDMLDDAFSTGACFDRNVTDIISALLVNNPIVTERFESESETGFVANYKHQTDYWHERYPDGTPRNTRGSEIFANLFAIETDQYRISRNFVERWFPEITGIFDQYIN